MAERTTSVVRIRALLSNSGAVLVVVVGVLVVPFPLETLVTEAVFAVLDVVVLDVMDDDEGEEEVTAVLDVVLVALDVLDVAFALDEPPKAA
jgi:hypothetical protein